MTYKGLGYSVIGMTNLPEAKLAREAELCYATVAMVTDFDCWHPDHDAVTVQDIIAVLTANADKAKALVARLARDFPREHEPCPIGSDRALDTAHHHRARGARQEAPEEARRGGGAGAEAEAVRGATSAPFPKFVIPRSIPRHELRKQRGTSNSMILVPLFDLKFLNEFAAGGAGTSNRRH